MTRPVGVKNKRTAEFDDLYDRLVKKYRCPVEVLFSLAHDENEQSTVRVTAATQVIRYKFATKKAIEHSGDISVANVWTETLRGFDADAPNDGKPLEFPESE